MATSALLQQAKAEGWTDEEVVARVLAGETALFEIIMRRYNQRLYRVARAILRQDAEAEDVMQDTYVRAYQHLGQFAGKARFATWLTRIAVHEALARAHRQSRFAPLDTAADPGDAMTQLASRARTPEQNTSDAEIRRLLEQAIEALPEQYRTVVMLRDVQEMSTAETAACLELTEENVKVRLHRARAQLRRQLYRGAGITAANAFQFEAPRCNRVVHNVFELLAAFPRPSQLAN